MRGEEDVWRGEARRGEHPPGPSIAPAPCFVFAAAMSCSKPWKGMEGCGAEWKDVRGDGRGRKAAMEGDGREWKATEACTCSRMPRLLTEIRVSMWSGPRVSRLAFTPSSSSTFDFS